MRRDPLTGIAVLDDTLEFRDTSESRVLQVLEQAADRSSMSDELARHITDWPTRYHFSRARGRLLTPLAIPAGARVLDIGAGTGAIARALGERGARVVALEGDLARARAAATRCAGLEQVEVVCGTLAGYDDDEPFDLVCLIGVLEYSQLYADEPDSALATLERARSLLTPGGCLVLAIENQLGLKYLLGYPEDHLGEPFAGVEGYLGARQIRTWSRRQLGELLTAGGLPHQDWLYPYPDYKLPATIVADAAFDQPDVTTLIDALVRKPSSEAGYARPAACHERDAHRVFLEAGLGRDVANSFLVVARADRAPTMVTAGTLAWFFGRERLRSWIRTRTVEQVPGGRRIATTPIDSRTANRQRGWLHQQDELETEFVAGPTVEQLALAACRDRDVEGLREVLGGWTAFLDGHARSREATARGRHPFLPAGTTRVLPGDMLDVSLSNLVASDSGLVLVDREWRVASGVDRDLVALRALWYFASELVGELAPHPFHPDSSVDDLALALADLAGLETSPDDLEALRQAEQRLQVIVTGRAPEKIAEELAWLGRRNPLDGSLVRVMPFTRLQRELQRLVSGLRQDSASSAATASETEAALARAEDAIAKYRQGNLDLERSVRELQGTITELQREVATGRATISQLEQEGARLRGIVEAVHRQLDATQHETRDTRARLEDLIARRGALEAEATRLASELTAAVARADRQTVDLAEARRITTELDRRATTLENRNHELENRKHELESRNHELEGELRESRAEATAQATRLAASERARDSLQARLAQDEIARRVDASRLTDLHSQVEDLQARLGAAHDRVTSLTGELGHWQQWHAAFDRRLPVRLLRLLRGRARGGTR